MHNCEKTALTYGQKLICRRILEISYQNNLSHIGSCLSAADIIYAIYRRKKPDERFILSSGHAGVALYAVLEEKGIISAADIKKYHVHPDRDSKKGIDLSTGSLGQGLPVALGMALADRNKNVYCLISDGECAEGSIWEAFRVGLEQQLDNLKIVVNANGWGAYDPIYSSLLLKRIKGFGYRVSAINGHCINEILKALAKKISGQPTLTFARTKVNQLPFLKGQDAHYYVMNERDYKLAMETLK